MILKIIISLLLSLSFSFAHDLQYKLENTGQTVVIWFFFPDGSKFSYENFEIYREGEKVPFQVGRTDALGRVIFIPDRAGKWLVKVYSEDGHGKNIVIEVNKGGYTEKGSSVYEKFSKVITGVGIIFGIFGLISIFKKRG
ncbi:MAG: hypothetical protein N2Z81_04260 [Hydrogenothermaceae bacterium]|nr:hypothetical protein [Hydrogenothermaceae bacterium]